MVRTQLSLVFLVLVFHHCSQPNALGQSPRIINGQPTDDFAFVAIVGSVDQGGFCTGTLISPYHILTAAHCAVAVGEPENGVIQIEGRIYVTTEIFIHPDFDERTLANDLAILELSEPVRGIVPAIISQIPPQIGDDLTLVGYGSGGDASGDDGTFGEKLVGVTTIDEVTATEIIWYFDDANESNSASGDSGGPGFLLIDGEYFLAAIISSGTAPDAALGDIAFNVRVDAFVDWIDLVLATHNPSDEDSNSDDDNPGEDGSGEDGSEVPNSPPNEQDGEGTGDPEVGQPPNECKPGQRREPTQRLEPTRHPAGMSVTNSRRPGIRRPQSDGRGGAPSQSVRRRNPARFRALHANSTRSSTDAATGRRRR